MPKKKIEGVTKIAVSGFKSLANECAIDIRPADDTCGREQLRQIEHHATAIDAEADAGGDRMIPDRSDD